MDCPCHHPQHQLACAGQLRDKKLDSVVPVPIKVAHLWRDVADRSEMDLLPQMHTVAERNREKDGVYHIQARV